MNTGTLNLWGGIGCAAALVISLLMPTRFYANVLYGLTKSEPHAIYLAHVREYRHLLDSLGPSPAADPHGYGRGLMGGHGVLMETTGHLQSLLWNLKSNLKVLPAMVFPLRFEAGWPGLLVGLLLWMAGLASAWLYRHNVFRVNVIALINEEYESPPALGWWPLGVWGGVVVLLIPVALPPALAWILMGAGLASGSIVKAIQPEELT